MIQFACPACNMVLSAPPSKAGSTNPCPGCGQMVLVPRAESLADFSTGGGGKKKGEGRTFFAFLRSFLWGLCFFGVVGSVFVFFQQIERARETADKTRLCGEALVWIVGAYLIAKSFEGATKSIEELCQRLRRR